MTTIKKRILAVIAVLCMIVQVQTPVFAETPDPQTTVSPENPTQNVSETEISATITAGISDYFSTNDNVANIETLVLSTDNYKLNSDDLQYLQDNFTSLKSLNASQCEFESKDIYDSFSSTFADIEYSCSEYKTEEGTGGSNAATPASDNEGSNAASPASDNEGPGSSGEPTPEVSYDVSISGICLLDHGSYAEVGAAYTTDDPNVKFRWLQYDLQKKEWSVVSDWNTGNWITWKPETAGDYWIYVEAQTSSGQTATSVYGHHYTGRIFELNGMSVINRGEHYDIGVAYKTNDTGITFRWQVYDLQNKTWTLISDNTKSNWVSWSFEKAGDYWVNVQATDSDGNVKSNTAGIHYDGLSVDLTGICVLENKGKLDMGVAYSSRDSKVQFRWQIYDVSAKTWQTVSDWNTGNWASWTPKKSGGYWLYVEAKTSTGNTKNRVMGYTIKPASITSFKTDTASPGWEDSTITLSGSYYDVIGEIAHSRFLVYDGSSWSEIARDTGSVKWTPGKTGNYLLCYELDNADGKAIAQSFKGYSIETPYANLTGIYVRNDGDLQYSMAASCQTNDKNAQYRWMYYDMSTGGWYQISGWSGTNSVLWKAPKTGSYWLHVEVKIHGGITKDYTIGYNVTRYSADLTAMLNVANNYSSPTNYILLINTSTRKVGIFTGSKGNWSPLKYWDCTVGKSSTPTVTGVFSIGSRGSYFYSDDPIICYWYTQFYGSYLFHSVLYNRYTGGLLDGTLGAALSHGCVRLHIDNAKWIYDNIPSGSTVVAY